MTHLISGKPLAFRLAAYVAWKVPGVTFSSRLAKKKALAITTRLGWVGLGDVGVCGWGCRLGRFFLRAA